MKRLVLRKGFSFQRTPEGAAQLLDARTGDALLLQAADVEAIAALAREGLDPQAPSAAGMLARFGSFLVTGEPPAENFYELDIADAPTMPSIPSVAPVTKTSPAIPRVPTFAELSVAAITAEKPPATTAPENWKVATARPPAVEPSPLPPAVHEQLNNDDWAVATSVPSVPAAPTKSKSGSHVAHAVSSMLPSLDELVPPRGSDGPSISSDSPTPLATQPSPVPQIPPVRPSPEPPRPSPVPAIAPVLPLESTPTLELEPLAADAPLAELEPLPEAATVTDAPLFELEPLPSSAPTDAEQELRTALAQAPAPETMPDDEPLLGQELPVEEPVLDLAAAPTPGPEQFRSQEENLRAALEQNEPPQSRADVQAMLTDTAKSLQPAAPAPAPVQVEPPAPMPSSRKPMVLTFLGVMLLALGVAASFTLRPDGEKPTPQPPEPKPPPVVAVIDAGAPAPVAVVETPKPEPVVIDAGAVVAVAEVDAGEVEVVEEPVQPRPVEEGVSAEVTARGRVKMGEVVAAADGTVSWTVEPGARVKSKQAIGSIVKGDGASVALTAPAVGLAMIKETGAAKKGAVLAEIIYFEAWAKAFVKDAKPTPAWQCEVISEAVKQRAPCKISVVTPKGSGAQVTVAIEPRWFDSATDAVLRLAAP
jgi:hypothetical protein